MNIYKNFSEEIKEKYGDLMVLKIRKTLADKGYYVEGMTKKQLMKFLKNEKMDLKANFTIGKSTVYTIIKCENEIAKFEVNIKNEVIDDIHKIGIKTILR